ncbi:hypothetical protein VKT23_014188 [Stygiomarasmius scandens]|uniref:Uncharacterized protein n=1 Tax=Marasmiellus scandens TaxID=2682957 RepID=A0ABR1J3A0_9AGAR
MAEPAPSSRSSSPADDELTELKVKISVHLNTYTRVQGGKKNKEQKSLKVKEIEHLFQPSADGYLDLMTQALERHALSNTFTVSKTSTFPFKLQVPPTTKASATSIDNTQDYIDAAHKILQNPLMSRYFSGKNPTKTNKTLLIV